MSILTGRLPQDHGFHVWEELIRVPMMIRGPGVTPGRVREPASLVDVLPTILAFAGVEAPRDLPGVDLRSEDPDPNRIVYAEARRWTTAVQGKRKWVLRFAPTGRDVVETRFYDIVKDPLEAAAAPWPADEEASRWLRSLGDRDPDRGRLPRRAKEGVLLRDPKIAPGVAEEQLEHLRGLGYIE